MKAFATETDSRIEEYLRTVEDEMLRTLTSLDLFATGRTAFAVVLSEDADDKAGMLMMTQWGDEVAAVKEAVSRVQAAMRNSGYRWPGPSGDSRCRRSRRR